MLEGVIENLIHKEFTDGILRPEDNVARRTNLQYEHGYSAYTMIKSDRRRSRL